MNAIIPPQITLAPQVRSAIENSRPVVALESTLMTHGLPYPHNSEIALEMEAQVTKAGAKPATIGVLDGEMIVGLDRAQIEKLARMQDARKISRRDLPIAAANAFNGGTTVAATMYLAHLASIQVLATGGIGGVHREAAYDISADLPELAGTPLVVVCSGAKAILDLPLTKEWLETHGVPVIGYQTEEFPAFYSRQSGLSVDGAAANAPEVAKIWRAKREMRLPGALLVTVPVPAEDEYPRDEALPVIERALAAAKTKGISGAPVTPFLLAEVASASAGRSLRANLALLKNNAFVAGLIAKAL